MGVAYSSADTSPSTTTAALTTSSADTSPSTTTVALTTSASNGNGNGVAPDIWYALALTGAIVALLALIALYITSRSRAGVILQSPIESPVQFSSSVQMQAAEGANP